MSYLTFQTKAFQNSEFRAQKQKITKTKQKKPTEDQKPKLFILA